MEQKAMGASQKMGLSVLFAFKGQFVLEIKTTISSINIELVLHVVYKPFKRPSKTVICEMIML